MNNTPTPRTDFAIAASNGQWSYVLKLCAEELERELTAVTEQRDQYKAALQSADNHNHEIATKLEIVTEQRDRLAEACSPSFDTTETDAAWSAHCIDPDSASGDPWDLAKKLETELIAVTEQRDRLAEALRKAISWGDSASHHILYRQNINWTYLNEAKEALQSLNQPTQ